MGLFDYHWVDVFTDTPFGGNPLTVFPKAGDLSDGQMQLLARELGNSETVFVVEPTVPDADVRLRFFSPTEEVPMAGHAVLGAHFILASLEHVTLEEPITVVRQQVGDHTLPVEVKVAGGEVTGVVMTTATPRFGQPFGDLGLVEAALGVAEDRIGPGDLQPQVVDLGVPYLVVPVQDLRVIQEVKADADVLAQLLARTGANRVYMFTMETEDPAATIHGRHVASLDPRCHEDPVTGAAAGCAASFLVRNQVLLAAPTATVVVEQGHEVDRPGRATVEVTLVEGQVKEVRIGGPVVHVGSGRFEV